jgi:uncharacterized membrane protein
MHNFQILKYQLKSEVLVGLKNTDSLVLAVTQVVNKQLWIEYIIGKFLYIIFLHYFFISTITWVKYQNKVVPRI